jgi:hypothetical protein
MGGGDCGMRIGDFGFKKRRLGQGAGEKRRGDSPASPEGEADGGQARRNGETGIRGQRSEVRSQKPEGRGQGQGVGSHWVIQSLGHYVAAMIE